MQTRDFPGFPQVALAKFILLANHVLSATPAATQRLKAHVGQCLDVSWALPPQQGWLRWLPQPVDFCITITPAGLLELHPEGATARPSADLRVEIVVPAPNEALHMWRHQQRPHMRLEGDARLAETVSWLTSQLQWDIWSDLQNWIGLPAAAVMQQALDRLLAIRTLPFKRTQDPAR